MIYKIICDYSGQKSWVKIDSKHWK